MTAEQCRQAPPIAHPVLRAHPGAGRDRLFLGDHAERIEGMDYESGRAPVDETNGATARLGTVYRRRGRPRPLVVWEHRCPMHRATACDTVNARRVTRRRTVPGDEPFRRRPQPGRLAVLRRRHSPPGRGTPRHPPARSGSGLARGAWAGASALRVRRTASRQPPSLRSRTSASIAGVNRRPRSHRAVHSSGPG